MFKGENKEEITLSFMRIAEVKNSDERPRRV